MHGGVGGRNCLSVALEDLFNRMSGTSWDAVSRTQLWNTKRPVWLQAIIHLVEPHVIPAVLELLDLLDSVIITFKQTKYYYNFHLIYICILFSWNY